VTTITTNGEYHHNNIGICKKTIFSRGTCSYLKKNNS